MHTKDLDIAENSLVAARKRLIAGAPVEERLEGLRPEEVFARFAPEERLAGLRPEEVFARFAPEERLAGLTPEQLAAALAPDVLEFLAQKAKQR